ncbi:hypothetical protein LPB136_05690 [Tenacibaculum todarodis]|uniref:Uncharacterized protein n=1 Tax=Tenacibaculum todarodis TaxID=1850252 RepID=A0A1L3JIB2_9FLAO|nr:hypothetical protein LPB136_05690 [Tenacibaculum todarodis]
MKNDRTPYDLNEFKTYLKNRDVKLLKLVNNIDIQYKRNNLGFISIYHKGVDNVDDSLKIKYENLDSFLDLFYKKGDIEIDYHYTNIFEKFNTIYNIGKDSIIRKNKINVSEIFRDHLKCDSSKLRLKKLKYTRFNYLSIKINKGNIKVSDTISAGVNSFYNNTEPFPENTKEILLSYIRQEKNLFHKDSIYFINFKFDDIDNYKCK